MPKRQSARASNLRRLLAQEAARIIAEQGIEDFGLAKRKAAERMGVSDRGHLPRNTEIEEALVERQRLFSGDEHDELIRHLRSVALRAMTFFKDFEPRLVGSVLSGTASSHSDVNLHLFAETPEDVAMCLIRDNIPYRVVDKRFRVGPDRHQSYPAYRFHAGEVPVEATVFPPAGLRQAPVSPIDGKAMRRARRDELDALLAEGDAGGGEEKEIERGGTQARRRF